MLEEYRVLSFVDEIDHVTIHYRHGKGLNKAEAVRLLCTHAVWAEEAIPANLDTADEPTLHQMLVDLRERIIKTLEA